MTNYDHNYRYYSTDSLFKPVDRVRRSNYFMADLQVGLS